MADKTPYAIMRIAKIKSFGKLSEIERHNTRQIPAGTVEGAHPPDDLSHLTGTYRQRAERVLKETGAAWESGKVLAVEVLVTTSPEWWVSASASEKEQWWRANLRFAEDTFGPGLIAFTSHVDESTPHAQFVGLPIYRDIERKRGAKPKTAEAIRRRAEEQAAAPKIWRLSHDRVFGGSPGKLAALQTRYHGYVAHLGLARGRDTVGLKIKHQTLKEYRKKLTRKEQNLAEWADSLAVERVMLEHYDEEVAAKHRDLAARMAEVREAEARLHERTFDLEAKRNDLRQREQSVHKKEEALKTRGAALASRSHMLDADLILLNSRLTHQRAMQRDIDTKLAEQAVEANRLAAKAAELAVRERQLDGGAAELEKRKQAQEIERERVVAERAKQRLLQEQVDLASGIFAGRIKATWDRRRNRPAILEDTANRPGLTEAWPQWLAEAVRQSLERTAQRSRLAAKVWAMLTRLRSARKQAQRELFTAAAARAAAQHREAAARQAVERATQLERTAQENAAAAQVDRFRAQTSLAEASLAQDLATAAKMAAQAAQQERGAAEHARDVAKGELAAYATQREELQHRNAELEVSLIGLRASHGQLANNIAALRSQEAALKIEKALLERERQSLAAERSRYSRSRQLFDGIATGRYSAVVTDKVVHVTPRQPSAGEAQAFPIADLAPWLPAQIIAYNQSVEQQALIAAIGKELDQRRKALIALVPSQAEVQRVAQNEEADLMQRAASAAALTRSGGMLER